MFADANFRAADWISFDGAANVAAGRNILTLEHCLSIDCPPPNDHCCGARAVLACFVGNAQCRLLYSLKANPLYLEHNNCGTEWHGNRNLCRGQIDVVRNGRQNKAMHASRRSAANLNHSFLAATA